MASRAPWIAAARGGIGLFPRSATSSVSGIRGRTQTTMAYKQAALGGTKKAHLSAARNKRLKLHHDHPTSTFMSEFLSLPQGVESALNVKSVQSFQVLNDSTYRLVLPEVRLLSFDACPVMDLRVATTSQDFTVKMLSFKFQGAEAMESANDHLKGLMVSRIKWHSKGSESFLELKMQIDLTMELVQLPFSLLPPAAVEIPGNLIMEAVVDNLSKELLENVVENYEQWMMRKKQQKLGGKHENLREKK